MYRPHSSMAAEEGPLAKIPYSEQEETRLLQASTLTSSHKSVIAFGLIGHGKSTFLNFILRRKHFTTSQGLFGTLQSVTKETESARATVEGQQLLLINTPGFIDPQKVENNDEQSVSEIFQSQSLDFRQSMLRAYLDAGEEVGAFILVYSLTARWTAEVTQMMKFLENMLFPWDHCIVVLTHGDHSFLGISEEERYKELKKAMANDELPKQLKEFIKKSNNRALIVESSRTNDQKYYRSVMKKFLALVSGIPGPYSNPHFLHFAQLVKKSWQAAYNAILHDKKSLNTLEAKTQNLFKEFQLMVRDVAVAQEEFIEHLHKIADMIDSKVYSRRVTAAAGCGTAACVAGIATFIFSVGLIPVTFGVSTAAITGGLAVAAGGVGATTIPRIVKWLKNNSVVHNTQEVYNNATVKMERLYQLYEDIMQKIQEDSLGHNQPDVHSLLFAHLSGVHIHGTKAKGDELCTTAKDLAVYLNTRKQADKQFKPGNTLNSGSLENSSLPVSFTLLARDCDVMQTVEASMKDSRASQKSKEENTQMLRECITTLEKEMYTIMTLCNMHRQLGRSLNM